MQFDNPMPTFVPEVDPDSAESLDIDSSSVDSYIGLQAQLRLQVESILNFRSILHGTFYIVLLLVLIVELFNSAIEAAIDRHGDEHHELSGRAKDMGSAAVMRSGRASGRR